MADASATISSTVSAAGPGAPGSSSSAADNQIALAPPLPGADSPMMKAIPYVVIALCAFLFWYAWTMEKKGVLR